VHLVEAFTLFRCKDNPAKIQVLVIGGSGSVGKEIVRQLVANDGYAVHSLDLSIPTLEKRVHGVVSFIQTDITNKRDIMKACRGIDVVFHAASLMPISVRNTALAMERVNIEGTRNVVAACKEHGIKRLIYTSSVTVTLSRDPRVCHEYMNEFFPLPKDPLNAYVRTKGLAETLVREANSENGLRTCALRPGMILGGRENFVMPVLMSFTVVTLGKGDHSISWVPVETAARVHILAEQRLAMRPVSSEANVYNVLSGNLKYRKITSFFAMENTGKDSVEVALWQCKMMAFINEAVYSLSGWTPFGSGVCSMALTELIPFSCSAEHTERELGWAETEPWQLVMRKIIADYKSKQEY
jgi:nucleoside-diphosphate-sugar epimerase